MIHLRKRFCKICSACLESYTSTPVPFYSPQGIIDSIVRSTFEKGDVETAIQLLKQFLDTYPAGPLTQPAMMLLGASHSEQGDYKQAARAYLEGYSFDIKSARASDSLLNLGLALNKHGEAEAACITLSEVVLKFPDTEQAADALSAREELACT